jgi:3-oxoacyl-[acyl-carrier-protein] synthase-1
LIEWRDSRFREFTVAVVPDDGLPELDPQVDPKPLTYREARMLRLAHAAAEEAMTQLSSAPGATAGVAIPCVVGLPELQTTIPINGDAFLQRLRRQSKLNITAAPGAAIIGGRAAALLAVRRGVEMVVRDRAPLVLVGGVDSYVDLHIMGTLDMQQRIRTDVNADGFAPGEGAGFLLLASPEAARARRLKPLAQILATATGHEESHIGSEAPYRGDGLAATFQTLFAEPGAADADPVGCVYASFNGENYWAKEFGVSLLRNKPRFADDHQMEHPSECFGDLGAAQGAVMLALAVLGIEGGYRRAPALVYTSSDAGTRAAVLIQRGG